MRTALLALLLAVPASAAAPLRLTAWLDSPGSVRAARSSDEPVAVGLTLLNAGKSPLTVLPPRHGWPSDPDTNLELVILQDGKPMAAAPAGSEAQPIAVAMKLRPRGSTLYKIPFGPGLKPGAYTFSFKYAVRPDQLERTGGDAWTGELLSNEVRLVVTAAPAARPAAITPSQAKSR